MRLINQNFLTYIISNIKMNLALRLFRRCPKWNRK